jgi:hypothetical protein
VKLSTSSSSSSSSPSFFLTTTSCSSPQNPIPLHPSPYSIAPQSQTPQKPFTQKLTHQTPPQNISVFLTPSPETSELSSQNPHQLLSFLPCNPMPINRKEAKKKKPASQRATIPSILLLLSVPTRKTQQTNPKRTAASNKQKDLFFVVDVVRLRSL